MPGRNVQGSSIRKQFNYFKSSENDSTVQTEQGTLGIMNLSTKLCALSPEQKRIMQKLIIIFIFLTTSMKIAAQDIIPDPPDQRSGYININELTFGYGLGSTEVENSKYLYGFTTVHGYEFNIDPFYIKSNISLCAGAGMLFYDEEALFPVVADMRYAINLRKISPFIFGKGGLLLNLDGLSDRSMLFVNGGAGARILLSNKVDLTIGAGLLMQFNREGTRDSFAVINAGVTFKPGSVKRVSEL